MNPQIWWYLARASGIVAWLFLTTAVLWGIFLSTDLFPKRRRPAWLLDLHRGLGALSLVAVAVHLAALVADSYVDFGIVDLLVPFASEWKSWQVALGVVALWGLVLVEATSLAMKRLPKKLWRGIHFTSYLTFLLTSLHGTFAGTDATNKMYVATSVLATTALVAAVTYRIVTRRSARPRRSATAAREAVSQERSRGERRAVPADSGPAAADTVPADTIPADTIPTDSIPTGSIPTDSVVGRVGVGEDLAVVLAHLSAAGVPDDRIRVLASDDDLVHHRRRHLDRGRRRLFTRQDRTDGDSLDRDSFDSGIHVGIIGVGRDEAGAMCAIARNSGLRRPHYFSERTYA